MRTVIFILAILALASLAFSADLSLKATWTPNTESDMASYKLYRTDVTRSLIGTIPHPPALPYAFVVTIPANTEGTLQFVLTALDTKGNESADSNTVAYPFDLKPPAAPGGFGVSN